MVKKKLSRRRGLFTESEINFLYLTEKERTKQYGEGVRKYYQRILKSANQGFQDYAILLIHLPKRHLENVDFVTGLRSIHNHLRKAKATDQIPEAILDATGDNLKACLRIIRKQHSQRLEEIAEKDFDKVQRWLDMAQKYPKPRGGEI